MPLPSILSFRFAEMLLSYVGIIEELDVLDEKSILRSPYNCLLCVSLIRVKILQYVQVRVIHLFQFYYDCYSHYCHHYNLMLLHMIVILLARLRYHFDCFHYLVHLNLHAVCSVEVFFDWVCCIIDKKNWFLIIMIGG